MVKDLRSNPIFKKNEALVTAKEPPRKDLLIKYKELVDQTIASRIRSMIFVGVGVYMAFSLLDRAAYPLKAFSFFEIRVVASILSGIVCIPNFFKAAWKYSVWTADLIALLLIGGICLMIYWADGATSHYHAGINLTLLGMAIVNGFYLWHNLVVCLIVLALYAVAVLASGTGWNGGVFFAACCFMSATGFFVVLMTQFYSSVHFKSFVQNEELKEDERKLGVLYGIAEEKSKIDDLTKIYNRAYFFEILSAKIDVCKRTDSFFYLTIFDIDHFKHINDTYGHLFGDQVIAAVARTVQRVIRMDSYLGRFGGDEFMIIIDKATQEEFLSRLKKVRLAIQQMELLYEGKPVSISASFGAVRLDPVMMDEKKLIGLADDALLEVKRSRRGEIKLANESGL